jgi:type IV pilus assembly protein PilA
MNKNRIKGFTLIEVLVVIAIISVLVTILLPSFNAARKKPYDTSALQCGKALVTAQVTYTAEHNNQAAGSVAQLNNTDVNEQCLNAGVQVGPDYVPNTQADGGNFNIGVGGANYAFKVWHQNGTGIYLYNKDCLACRFNKLN